MNIWEVDSLVLFIIFVVPGFVSLKVYELLVPGQPKDISKQLIDAIAYSCLNYSILSFFIFSVEQSQLYSTHPWLYFLFYFVVLFVMPVTLVIFWKKIRSSKFIQSSVPHPIEKPWDWHFSKRKPYWVKIVKNDGSIIAGRYSDNSFASSAPAPDQIYLEEVWILNDKGGFVRPKNETAGVIVISTEISHIEFRN